MIIKKFIYIFSAAVVSVLIVITGFTQEDVITVSDSAFSKKMRPDVPFNHEQHNEKAEIDECGTCHHLYEEGELIEDDSSEDMECSECHLPDNGDTMELTRVYHLMCKGCHAETKKGPVMCGECHPRK